MNPEYNNFEQNPPKSPFETENLKPIDSLKDLCEDYFTEKKSKDTKKKPIKKHKKTIKKPKNSFF